MAERTISTRVKLTGADEYSRQMKKVNGSLQTTSSWMDTMKGILASNVIQKGMSLIADTIKGAVDASVEFEDALTGVAKTTTMSETQLYYFGESLKDLSERIPMSAAELAGLAESAGQLGIADRDILDFIEVMAAMGVSTNLTADQAATDFARIANIMGTTSDEYSRMGSTVVELGNNFATTEAEIVDMATSLAGYGKMAGMTEANIFAISTALSSVGIEAEAGSTAIGTIISTITKAVATESGHLEEYAELAGMTADEFVEAWNIDPGTTFVKFVEGIGEADKAGKNTLLTLAELNITNVRQTKAMTALVGAGDLLARSIDTADKAWKEDIALTNEAGKKYATTASQISMMENAWENAKIAGGDALSGMTTTTIERLKEMAQATRELLTDEQDLPQMIRDAEDAYADQQYSLQASAVSAERLIQQLENMGDYTDLDYNGQLEYAATFERLAEIVPSVTGMLDKETMTIRGGTEALRDAADASMDLTDSQNDLERLRNIYDALTHAQEEYAGKRSLYENLRMQADQMRANMDAAEEMENYYIEMRQQAGLTREEDYELSLKQAEAHAKWEEWGQQLDDLTRDEIVPLNEEIILLGSQIEENEHYIDEYKDTLTEMTEEAENAAVATEEMSDAEAKLANKSANYLTWAQMLSQELAEKVSDIRATIENEVGGINWKSAKNLKELNKDLDGQIKYMQDYMTLLDQAQELGLDGELLTELSDGSEESKKILEDLVKGGADKVEETMTKLEEANAVKDTFAQTLAETAVNADEQAQQIIDGMNDMVDEMNQGEEASQAAKDTIQGYIDGVNALLPSLTRTHNLVNRLTTVGSGGGGDGDGSTPIHGRHANGLDYVPFDGYRAELHKGEMVLTALAAKAYRSAGGTSRSTVNNTSSTTVRFGDVYVREEADTRRIADNIAKLNKRKAYGRGYR